MLEHYSGVCRHDIDATMSPLEVLNGIIQGLLKEMNLPG